MTGPEQDTGLALGSGHAPIEGMARTPDGRLTIGQVVPDWETLPTPTFLYASQIVGQRIERLRRLFPADLRIHYAVKANPLPALLRWCTGRLDGADVASGAELQAAIDAGFAPETVGFAGPGKREDEIALAARLGAVVTIESERQWALAARHGARVAVRVNPALELRGAGQTMGGGASPFGVDAEALPALIATARARGWPAPEGLHVYFGSQILGGDRIAQALRACATAAEGWVDALGGAPRWLNLGGGFGVPYFPGESPLLLDPVAQALDEIVGRWARRAPDTRLRIELGRWLVAEAGVYACRVLERKVSRGKMFLVTDGGLHHLQAATGTLGQVIRRNYPLALAGRADVDADSAETVDVVGPLCTPLDCLGRGVRLPRAEPGDVVVVFRAGAYGATASPTAFLGHPPALEQLL